MEGSPPFPPHKCVIYYPDHVDIIDSHTLKRGGGGDKRPQPSICWCYLEIPKNKTLKCTCPI